MNTFKKDTITKRYDPWEKKDAIRNTENETSNSKIQRGIQLWIGCPMFSIEEQENGR